MKSKKIIKIVLLLFILIMLSIVPAQAMSGNDVFNSTYYANKYADLRNAFGYDGAKLSSHFFAYGVKEGRSASLLYDANYYLEKNPDLKKVFGNNYEEIFNHFINYGIKEGRVASPIYNAEYYLANNADLRKAFGNNYEEAFKHFVNYGMKEGRIASANFDVRHYLANNADIKKAFGNNYEEVFKHYIDYGIAEKRITSHISNGGKITKQATCTENGVKTYSCRVCGKVIKTEVIKATGSHTWNAGEVTTNPTCSANGVKTFTCTKCRKTKTEAIAVNPEKHVWNEGEETKAPTCKDKGVKTFTCTGCGKTKTEEIDATGKHDYKKVAIDASCTVEGKYINVCKNCKEKEMTTNSKGEEVVKYYTGKIDHDFSVLTATVEATCDHAGYNVYTCSICGEENEERVTSPKLDHDFTAEDAHTVKIDATCTKAGNPEYYTCSKCHKNYPTNDVKATDELESIVIPALDHDYVETVTPATCTEDGERVYKCSRCDSKLTDKIDKTEHKDLANIEPVQAVEATCHSTGNPEYKKCACGKYFVEDNENGNVTVGDKKYKEIKADDLVISAKNEHIWGDWRTTQDATEDTCLEETRECTVEGCGASEVRTSHTKARMESAATCTEKEIDLCSKCGKTYETGSVLGHNMISDAENTVAATCETDGVTATKCSRCDHKETTPEKATAHTLGAPVSAKAPTCTEPGNIAYSQCSGCKKYFVEDENGTVTINNKKYTEKSEADVKISATGHKWNDGEETKKPTCVADGVRTYTCKNDNCGKKVTEVITKLGHKNWTKVSASNPTCTTAGNSADYYTCENEKDIYYVLAEANDEDTITVEGKKYKTASKPAEKQVLGHNFTSAGIVTKTKVAEDSDDYTGTVSLYCDRCKKNEAVENAEIKAVKTTDVEGKETVTGYTVTTDKQIFTFDVDFKFKEVKVKPAE